MTDNNENNDSVMIPIEKTFNLPEGHFRARLVEVVSKPKSTDNGVVTEERFLFEVDVPSVSAKNLIPMAGRNFQLNLNPGSDFRKFLEGWLGKEFLQKNGGKELVMESLKGKEADITLVHHRSKKFKKPLVIVALAHPAGSLALTESSTTEAEISADSGCIKDRQKSKEQPVKPVKQKQAKVIAPLPKAGLTTVDRSAFKRMIVEIIREEFGVGLRSDLQRPDGSYLRGWKGLNCRAVGSLARN